MKTIDLLVKFANQRPGLDYANYGDPQSYRKEVREITNDLHDFRELLNLAFRRVDNLEDSVKRELTENSGRLTLKGEALEYITGQYFPVEYRPAACRILVNIIWNSYRTETYNDGTSPYNTGDDIRKAIRRNLSRRCGRNYFN